MTDVTADGGTVADFLERLSARSPTPAGGSVAALCTAQAAALVAMVARYCESQQLAEQAMRLVERGQQLARDDEKVFGAVAAAWSRPRGTAEDNRATAKVRFLAELRNRVKPADPAADEQVEERRVAEIWTFERTLGASDPNWVLARTEPANA